MEYMSQARARGKSRHLRSASTSLQLRTWRESQSQLFRLLIACTGSMLRQLNHREVYHNAGHIQVIWECS